MTIVHENFLRLMSPADRSKLGKAGVTAEEALAAQECKSEGELEDLLVTWLQAHRGVNRVIRSRRDKKTTRKKGDPDLMFIYRGVPFCFELKSPTGKQSVDQQHAQVALLKDGWSYYVIRSFAEAKTILDDV